MHVERGVFKRRGWTDSVAVWHRKRGLSPSGRYPGNISQQRPRRPAVAGIHWSGSTPHAFCAKSCNGTQCGWNATHSTKYHNIFAANPAMFKLADHCPFHPLVLAQGSSSTSKSSAATECSSLTAGSSGDHVLVNKSQAKDVLEKLERNSASHETVEIVGALRTLFSLN